LTRQYHINATLYIDGIFDNSSGTDPSDSLSNNADLLIGDGGSTDFDGEIDEFAIWNRSLSASEIADLYNLTAGKYYWQVNVTDTQSNTNSSGVYEFTLGIEAQPPQITQVYNETIDLSLGPNQGPSSTNITINFTAYDANGAGDLNDSTAKINITGSVMRENATCAKTADFGNYANYTC